MTGPARSAEAAQGDQPTDRELCHRIVTERDADSFGVLYRRHTARLYATAVRLAESSADAEDVVHDTWLRAVGSLVRFGWQSSLRTWLTGILLNRLRELRRAANLEVPIDEAIVAIGEGGVIAETADPIDLERAVLALPPGFRDVLVLHDVEGFTHAEIGLMLGIQPGTSKSQLARARRALRRRLTDERETAHAPE